VSLLPPASFYADPCLQTFAGQAPSCGDELRGQAAREPAGQALTRVGHRAWNPWLLSIRPPFARVPMGERRDLWSSSARAPSCERGEKRTLRAARAAELGEEGGLLGWKGGHSHRLPPSIPAVRPLLCSSLPHRACSGSTSLPRRIW
jgi:hypothetical protein